VLSPQRLVGLLAVTLALLWAGALVAPPAGAASTSLAPARRVLSLTEARLGLMDQVMASKWLSRSPIEDVAQETAVKEAAVAKAGEIGVAAAGTRRLFAAEIAAAKEVQLGWGSHWLLYGAPPDLTAPDLTELRARLSAISAEIVAALPGLVSIGEAPRAGERLEAAAARILTVRYLGREGRASIVEGILAIRAAG
jgi:chorismate mutase-like protein